MELQPAATYQSTGGMVCAIDHLAASAGLAMLRRGGNAVDAAIATNAVLAVTSQHLCGMGGDLLAVVAAPGDTPLALNASGRAGSGADAERLRAEGHSVMPFSDDIRSVTVPGCVDGWIALHDRFARLSLAEVLAPALEYAGGGFPASPTLVASIGSIADLAESADYLANGPLRQGAIVRRPGVERALRAIVDGGRDGFYQGEFGERLFSLGAGEYDERDFATPNAEWTAPLTQEAFGKRLFTVPPNSSGYLTLASSAIASGLDLPRDPGDPLFAHLLIEASRQAAADRPSRLYDGADGEAVLARAELDRRRGAIDPHRAASLGDTYRPGGTIALVAVDADRLAVSVLQSNCAGFGARIAVPELRIFLHNRGIGFSLTPGHPAEYGPGRRPPHTLCPTIVTNLDGTLRATLGTMGGDSQPQILLQVLARLLTCDETPGDALAAGRFVLMDPDGGTVYDTWRRRGQIRVVLEGQTPPHWFDGLVQRGHRTERAQPYGSGFGHAHLIVADGDLLTGATDPRPRAGSVAAY